MGREQKTRRNRNGSMHDLRMGEEGGRARSDGTLEWREEDVILGGGRNHRTQIRLAL